MITTVTLNPVIEQTQDFKFCTGFQTDYLSLLAKANGLNSARIAAILGERFKHDPLSNIDIISDKNTPFSNKEIYSFVKEYIRLLKHSEIIIASGSLPSGLPKTFYGDMVKIARDNNVRVIINVTDDYLEEAVKARPFMIKISVEKLQALMGYDLNNEYKIIYEARCICKQGIEVVAISLGKEGAIFTTKEGTYRVYAPKVNVDLCEGYEDAFLAGFAVEFFRKAKLENAFKYAVAAGTAVVIEDKIGDIDVTLVDRIFHGIKIKKRD